MNNKQRSINVGFAGRKERLKTMIKLKSTILFIIFITVSGCSEFALIASASSVAASQNTYIRSYGALDFGVVITTNQGIKTHAYKKAKGIIKRKNKE